MRNSEKGENIHFLSKGGYIPPVTHKTKNKKRTLENPVREIRIKGLTDIVFEFQQLS